jgi:hypothetical protein
LVTDIDWIRTIMGSCCWELGLAALIDELDFDKETYSVLTKNFMSGARTVYVAMRITIE